MDIASWLCLGGIIAVAIQNAVSHTRQEHKLAVLEAELAALKVDLPTEKALSDSLMASLWTLNPHVAARDILALLKGDDHEQA